MTDTESILADVEATYRRSEATELERTLSINDWIDRVRGYAKEAHMLARAGEAQLEREAWVTLAAVAVARVAAIDFALENVESVELVREDDA